MMLAFLSSSDGLEMNWRLTPNKLVSGEAFEINGWNRLKAAFFVATSSALELRYIKLPAFQ